MIELCVVNIYYLSFVIYIYKKRRRRIIIIIIIKEKKKKMCIFQLFIGV